MSESDVFATDPTVEDNTARSNEVADKVLKTKKIESKKKRQEGYRHYSAGQRRRWQYSPSYNSS